ncbi:MAG: glycosyltransferase family 39 protein, partial [Candidatus Mariimomonas ferrooxydans]
MERDIKRNWFESVFLKTWRPYIWIFIIGLLVYLKTLSFGFVDYDDRHLIVTNYNFLSELSNIFKAFTQDVFHVPFHHSSKSYYRPLLTVSLMFDAQVGGTSPIVYHLTNIIIHLTASRLLFLFLIKLKYRKEPVLLFSLIFTVHPALTQAIAWIPGRNDSLLAVFTLLGFVSFLNLSERKNWRYYFLHMLFFALALFTKETALALIPVCIFYLYFAKKERILFSKKIGLIAGWLFIALSWFLLRMTSIENPDITVFFILKSLLFNLPGIIQYSGKILFPFNLSVYPIMKDGNFYYGIVTIILLLTAVFLSKRKSVESVMLGSSWFILFLLPSLIGSNPGAQTKLLEHRIYLPLVGVIILLLETDMIKKLDYRKKYHNNSRFF